MRGRLGHGWRNRAHVVVAALALACLAIAPACTEHGGEDQGDDRASLDTRLEVHAPLASTASAEGLAYVQAVAEAHRVADDLHDEAARLETLRVAVELPVPAGDGTAELLHYEVLARTAELHLARGEAERARALLEPRLAPAISLPLDRAAARCLVDLGDAAAQTGDHALAMSSYARALEMLSLLVEEAAP